MFQSYVHVSTAYSQCVRRVVPETVPKMSVHYKEVLSLIDSLTDEDIEKNLTKIIQGWPNTYTFTKAMCEEMLMEEGVGLPICIFRPAAVLSTYKEPVRGWTDNLYGPLGLMVGLTLGLLHFIYQDDEISLDMVPVDYTVNCLLASAWDSVTNKCRDAIQVYNYVSSPSRSIPWRHFFKYSDIFRERFAFQQTIWCTSCACTKSLLVADVTHFFLHKVPGIILDKIAVWNGQKARLTKIYDTISKLGKHTHFFATRMWEFESENVQRMLSLMTPEDKTLFNFDVRDVDVFEHTLIGKLGVRYYYLKEKMETLPQAQRKFMTFWWVHHTLKFVLGLALLKVLVMVAHLLPI